MHPQTNELNHSKGEKLSDKGGFYSEGTDVFVIATVLLIEQSYLQTDEPNYFPELEFWNFVILKCSVGLGQIENIYEII